MDTLSCAQSVVGFRDQALERITALRKARYACEDDGPEWCRLTRELAGWTRFLRHCERFLADGTTSDVPEIRFAIRQSLGRP